MAQRTYQFAYIFAYRGEFQTYLTMLVCSCPKPQQPVAQCGLRYAQLNADWLKSGLEQGWEQWQPWKKRKEKKPFQWRTDDRSRAEWEVLILSDVSLNF